MWADSVRSRILCLAGDASREAGRLDEATDFYKQALALDPGHVGARKNLVQVCLSLGRQDEAAGHFRHFAASDPDNTDFRDILHRLETEPVYLSLPGAHAPERQIYMSALLPMLADSGAPVSILEIGSFMGASMLTWAKAVERLTARKAEIVCIDPWEAVEIGQYEAEMGPQLRDGLAHMVFLTSVRMAPKRVTVTAMRGISADVLPQLSGRTFDIVYIDGCHLYPEVLRDIEACDPLTSVGGFICGDDLEAQLHEVDAALIAADPRADFVADPVSGRRFHLGVSLSVGQFFGPVSAFHGFWVMRKGEEGYEPVSMKGATGALPVHWPKEYQDRALAVVSRDALLAEVF